MTVRGRHAERKSDWKVMGDRGAHMSTTVSHSILIVILAPLQFGGFMYYEIVHKASKVILFIFSQLTH